MRSARESVARALFERSQRGRSWAHVEPAAMETWGALADAAIAAMPTPELLTEAELRAMDLTADLVNVVAQQVSTDGAARPGDMAELCHHVHNIQHMIMAQAAARAYPDRFRLMGGDPAGRPRGGVRGESVEGPS